MAANDCLESFSATPVLCEPELARPRSKHVPPKPVEAQVSRHRGSVMSYLPVTALLPAQTSTYLAKPQLERWLATTSKVDKAIPFRVNRLLQLTERERPYEDMPSLVRDIRAYARVLLSSGLDALVIDTLSDLSREQRDSIAYAVTHIWLSGIDVVLVDANDQRTSFNDIREVVNGQEFIRTYINSMWSEARERKRHRRQVEVRSGPGRAYRAERKAKS